MAHFSFINLLEQLIELRIVLYYLWLHFIVKDTNQDEPNEQIHRVKCEKAMLKNKIQLSKFEI